LLTKPERWPISSQRGRASNSLAISHPRKASCSRLHLSKYFLERFDKMQTPQTMSVARLLIEYERLILRNGCDKEYTPIRAEVERLMNFGKAAERTGIKIFQKSS